MSHRLIVLPDDSAKPLINALDGAKRSINIRMFLFTDPDMVTAVKAAQARSMKVRVMRPRSAATARPTTRKPARRWLTAASRCATAARPLR